MRPSRVALVVALCAVAVEGSCASACAAAAADAHRRAAASAHVYDRPIDAVWPDALAALAADGARVDPVADARFVVATPWEERPVAGDDGGTTVVRGRLVVEGLAVGDRRARVEARVEEQDAAGRRTATSRATDIEWRVLQRAAPEDAARIEADAQRRGDEARAGCARCGAACAGAIEAASSM